MKVVLKIVVFLVVLVGCAVGYHEVMMASSYKPNEVKLPVDNSMKEEVIDLKLVLEEKNQTIKELEEALAEARKKKVLDKKPEELMAEMAVEEKKVAESNPVSRWKKRMEDMKKNNPEEYEKRQQRIREFQDRMSEGLLQKESYFASVDTSKATDKQLENHEKLQKKIAKVNNLMEKTRDESLPDEEMMSAKMEIRKEFKSLDRLLDKERELILGNLATDIGYGEDETKQFVDYINHVVKQTDLGNIFKGTKGKRRK